MNPSLKIHQSLNPYQHKLKPTFISRQVGLNHEIQLSRLTAGTFDVTLVYTQYCGQGRGQQAAEFNCQHG